MGKREIGRCGKRIWRDGKNGDPCGKPCELRIGSPPRCRQHRPKRIQAQRDRAKETYMNKVKQPHMREQIRILREECERQRKELERLKEEFESQNKEKEDLEKEKEELVVLVANEREDHLERLNKVEAGKKLLYAVIKKLEGQEGAVGKDIAKKLTDISDKL